ncbi:MAG TPA: PHP domain-containing protein, partial [bacterium]|nr:PHP domain-containing protein [bacterium]
MDQIPLLLAKSEYSADSGSADAAELVRAAARFHYAAIALADVDNLCAQVKFHEAARTCGIRAITGVELRVDSRETRPRRLVLLARNLCGYESLCRIVSKRRTSPAASVRDPLDAIDAGT